MSYKWGRIVHAEPGTGDGDQSLFHWLTQYLEHIPFELGQLVEEENPIVCQRDLPRLRILSATYQSHIGNTIIKGGKINALIFSIEIASYIGIEVKRRVWIE